MTKNAAEQLAALLSATRNPPWFQDDRKRHCAYCGTATEANADPAHGRRATRDHILAKAQGGKVTIPSCRACNQDKAKAPFPDFLKNSAMLERRSGTGAKPWPEHELWAAYAAAVLRRTHTLMSAMPPHPIAPSALSSSPRGERNKPPATVNVSGSTPSSPVPARKASAGTSAAKKARAPG